MKNASTLIICNDCDLVQTIRSHDAIHSASCSRCGGELARTLDDAFDYEIALLVTSAILFLIMNVFPLVEMRVNGVSRATTLIGAVHSLYLQGMIPLAMLVVITTVVSPAVEIGGLFLILLLPRMQRIDPLIHQAINLIRRFHPWSMIEVFMLGVLVTIVKLSAFADIVLGPALWACAGIIVTIAALKTTMPVQQLWHFSQRAAK
jgi:paraquat-inducible protein A